MKKIIHCAVLIMFIAVGFSQECYQSSIVSPVPFQGNNGEIFKLTDGSVWEVKYEYEYLYEYYPSVVVCPGRGSLIIGEKVLNVELISNGRSYDKSGSAGAGEWEVFDETYLPGQYQWNCGQTGSVFKTASGKIYEVTGATIQLVLEIQPDVMVLRNGNVYKLIVDGFDEPLLCECLNCSSAGGYSSSAREKLMTDQAVIETIIISDFDGLEYGNIYQLANGQIWEQTDSWIWTWLWINPSVMIWNDGGIFKMKVEQIDHAVMVKRIK